MFTGMTSETFATFVSGWFFFWRGDPKKKKLVSKRVGGGGKNIISFSFEHETADPV